MPAEQGIGAASGALSGAAAGSMIMPGVGTAIGAVVGGVAGWLSSKKAKTPAYKPLDISKIIEESRANAATTLAESKRLEEQYFPGTKILRNATDVSLGRLANQSTAGFQARNSLLDGLGSSIADSSISTNPLLRGAAERIMGQLNLGGKLDAETQNAAARNALQGAAQGGIAGSGAGRGLVARDLGLTSLALQQQRQQAALGAGNTLASLGLQGESLRLQDYLGRYNAAAGAAGQDIQSTGLLAGLVDARQMPNAGLSSSDIANLYVGQNNAANQSGMDAAAIAQQRSSSNLNALLGLGTAAAGFAAGRTPGTGGLFGSFTTKTANAAGAGGNAFYNGLNPGP